MDKVKLFIDTFKPYRKKYTKQTFSSLFNDNIWYTHDLYLSDYLISKAIEGYLKVGYFISHTTNLIGIDIDDHKGKGDAYQFNIYNQVIGRLNKKPSLIAKSPRGLHLYYFLTERISFEIVNEIISKKLRSLPVEIKPTPNTALRIDSKDSFLNNNFQLLNVDYKTIIENIERIHPVEIMGNDILPNSIRQSLAEKRYTLKTIKAIESIEAVENKLLPLENGATNEAFLQLCNIYRCKGLDIDDALFRFTMCLEKSPYYTGDLRNYRRLKSRVESEYKNNNNAFIPVKKERQQGLFTPVIIENVINEILLKDGQGYNLKTPKTRPRDLTRKLNTYRRFLSELIGWSDFNDEIYNNKKTLCIWDYLYTYYRKNMKAGYYPLPSNLLEKWKKTKQGYKEILKVLSIIGLIEAAPYKYSKRLNICKYYKIKTERFLTPPQNK